MPLYDFQCLSESCGEVFEAISSYEDSDKVKCKYCDGDTKRLISFGNYIPFHEGWYEHFTDKPIYISNKQELKDACEKYDKYSTYLEDM